MEKLAIIGSGTMGHSIALSAAWAGMQVKMYGLDANDLEKGFSGIENKLAVLLKNGLVNTGDIQDIKARISGSQSINETIRGATFIIECIPEDINLKKDLFQSLDKLCGEEVILASNTSGLSPTCIASDTLLPQRILVTHFWNPAHLIPLVEVLRGEKTNDHTLQRAFELLKLMNKKPIEVKKEVPGLVGNRLQFALFREAQHILQEGIASKEDIDIAVTYSIGQRLPITGPFMSADMGGLDVFSAISDYLFKDLSKADQSLPLLKKLVQQNKLGTKTGEGYYLWDKDFSEQMNNKREQELIRFLKQDKDNKQVNIIQISLSKS